MYKIISIIAFLACIIWLYLEPSPEPVVVLLLSTAAFFRDEVHGIIGFNFMSLTPKSTLIRNFNDYKYSFTNEEYINPKILEDLIGWVSDTGDQVVSINISESNKSNKYFSDISSKTISKKYPIVTAKEGDETLSYQYVGCSFSGVHIIQTWSASAGVAIFCNILLVTVSNDSTIDFENGKYIKINRLVIKKVGSLPLADRYDGEIGYQFGFLSIPSSNGRKSLRTKNSHILVL
ncbi:hypothetical protein [Sulfurimonas hydrogeniphila]|uniref:hypothetical protein n=1 Tax=Sulfurimonas hydrogeniphila TaxID=2509341 RepID=UPI001CB6E5C1|nr:hypothetical protein [Sulfurimonas hydrogeniphila]